MRIRTRVFYYKAPERPCIKRGAEDGIAASAPCFIYSLYLLSSTLFFNLSIVDRSGCEPAAIGADLNGIALGYLVR